ncbi:LysR family transcriptional regulator [Pseudooceanicola sp. CBS1P-1]|nr:MULTISPECIES: LysR family transcriptional regulator [Pseudooceanicola]MBT9384363.1 LysR family transcriptional regulator [Pseudooceanicola endophyticus]
MRDLEAFVSVMATGSMTGAARQLGIGQPAVTRMIRDLEAQVGFALFERNGPRISPTAKGLLFFEDARQLLSSFTRLSRRAVSLRDETVGALALAATPTMAAGLAPVLMDHLGAGLPPAVTLTTMDAEHLARALQSGACDYGLSALPFSHAGVECLATAEASLVAVLPEAQAEDADRPFELAQLAGQRLLTVGNSYRVRHAINAALLEAGVTPGAEITTNSSLNAILSARAGLGIALVDCVSARGVPVPGVAVRPLARPIPYAWGLFRRGASAVADLEALLCDGFRRASEQVGGVCAVSR